MVADRGGGPDCFPTSQKKKNNFWSEIYFLFFLKIPSPNL